MNLTSTSDQPQVLGRTSKSANLLNLSSTAFDVGFGRSPFLIGHNLTAHPLFEFSRLLDLARALPGASVEYNAGNLAVNQDPNRTPRNGLSAEETIRRIEQCRSWMVLKNVEQDAEYRDLLHRCLGEIEASHHQYGHGICHREGFVFISSPGSVTPYHMDPECNFLLQIRGKKQVSLFDGNDRSVLAEPELERFYAGGSRRGRRSVVCCL